MGHARMGRLPASRKWRQVVALISGGADVREVAAETSTAAETGLASANRDPVLCRAF